MKKSNIILISILCIFVVLIVGMQLHLKYAISKQEDNSIGLDYTNFNTLDIGTGWNIKVVQAKETKISIFEDSIKSLISLDNNILSFKDTLSENGKFRVEITKMDINKIIIKGNSLLKYSADYIDSIDIKQTIDSKVIIKNVKDDADSETDDNLGEINFMSIALFNKSDLHVYNDVSTLTGKLSDSCKCVFTEKVRFVNFSKSTDSNLRSW